MSEIKTDLKNGVGMKVEIVNGVITVSLVDSRTAEKLPAMKMVQCSECGETTALGVSHRRECFEASLAGQRRKANEL